MRIVARMTLVNDNPQTVSSHGVRDCSADHGVGDFIA